MSWSIQALESSVHVTSRARNSLGRLYSHRSRRFSLCKPVSRNSIASNAWTTYIELVRDTRSQLQNDPITNLGHSQVYSLRQCPGIVLVPQNLRSTCEVERRSPQWSADSPFHPRMSCAKHSWRRLGLRPVPALELGNTATHNR